MVGADSLPKQFLDLCQKCRQRPEEISINNLLSIDGLSGNTLADINMLESWFHAFDLEVFPSFQEGSFEQSRLIKPKQYTSTIEEVELLKIIEVGENFLNEFKSTLHYDVKRAANDPKAVIVDLKSTQVLHSALKTIAGFLNWEGGKLLIGVADDATMIGIEKDYCFLSEEKKNIDGWELDFRNQINGKFYEGNIVNQHMNIKFTVIRSCTVAVVEVFPRKKLSFVNKISSNEYVLYCRQGNSTREIPLIEFEEFIERRRQAFK